MSQVDTAHAWWSRLRHQGLLLSPVVMLERFASAPEQAHFSATGKLRDAHTRFVSTAEMRQGDAEIEQSAILAWVDALLDPYIGHRWGRLARQNTIPEKLTAVVRIGTRSETIRPHRVVHADANATVPALLVLADTSAQVGRGRGRTVYARFLELLRGTGHRLGLLTNGYQFRLVYAGLDFESWCEWEADRWFDDGEGTEELGGLRQLLSPEALKPVRENVSGLLDAVEESRKRQADLSSVLRENVRQAVEYLLEDVSAANRTDSSLFNPLVNHEGEPPLSDAKAHEALHQATVRVVMRLVVCLFAESRQLLPVNDPIYAQAYGVRSLYERLEEAVRMEGGVHTLFNHHIAWPRLMALFRLIHGGSAHGAFALRAYGGALFRPGDPDSSDPVARALHILEHAVPVGDATIHAVLRKLMRGPLPVLRGRQKTFVEGPVDYTDLRTEFIGLIYEGLLDYRVKRTDAEIGPQIFLNLGREPVLPLRRLEEMLANDRNGLKNLLTTLRKESVTATVASEEEGEEASDEERGDSSDEAAEESVVDVEAEGEGEVFVRGGDYLDAVESAKRWAREAVVLAGLVNRQRARESDAEYQARIEDEATRLIKRVVATGEFYLVRAGNTRKGTGTFYTRPQLAVPTVHRTLQSLCYDKAEDGSLLPKTPEAILGLKVCDPACGSASFLVAALHYLTEALYKSLCHHRHLDDPPRAKRITLPLGRPRTSGDTDNLVPFPPDDPHIGHRFEDRIKALLRRHVVERCLYGVDLNPLAVEFARVSLWVETLDPELPFSFLDHKLKVGNSLVGCWLDRVEDYPLKAWEREGGDGKEGPRTQQIETLLKGEKVGNRRPGDGRIKREMRRLIEARFQGYTSFLDEPGRGPIEVVTQARLAYEKLHEQRIDDQDGQEDRYRSIERSEPVRLLKLAMDEWCAVWFWPADPQAMPHVPTPLTFHQASELRSAIVSQLAADLKFFHWELAFPDVFTPDRSGFDAMIGNPPWDVMKPNSQEFFTDFDPLYRTYDKQAALRRQSAMFASMPSVLEQWDDYNARFKAMANWTKCAADPFDLPLARGSQGSGLTAVWAKRRLSRLGYADPEHPFRLQGSADLNSYKMFAEVFWNLMKPDGRLGVILPTGIYSDFGTKDMRETLLHRGRIDLLYAFQNEKRVFSAAHHSFKQVALFVSKCGKTESFRTRFRMGVGDSPEAQELPDDILRNDSAAMVFTPDDIRTNSPKTLSLVELKSDRDLAIFRKVYARSIRIGDNAPGWKITYASEFHMTNDSKHFPPLEKWEAKGYKPDVFGRWIGPDGQEALPLYQGASINLFDIAQKYWSHGHGRTAIWNQLPHDQKLIRPQMLMARRDTSSSIGYDPKVKVAVRNIARSTDTRTLICCSIDEFPCNHKLPTLRVEGDVRRTVLLGAILSSFVSDLIVRVKVAGSSVDWYHLSDLRLPAQSQQDASHIDRILISTVNLTFIHRHFAPVWLWFKERFAGLSRKQWKEWWAVTEADRLRLRVEIDALCADLYGLDPDDFEWIVRDDSSDPKGFYRVDRQLPFRERLTGLAAAAFRALKEGKWSAESAAELSNDEFFDILGIPELTNAAAAHSAGLPGPLIEKREGCHVWKPEAFPADDPRHGWTWDDCWNDAVSLLGSEEAVRAYISEPKSAESLQEKDRITSAPPSGTEKPTVGDEPFRLQSDQVSGKRQRRLSLSDSTPTLPLPTRQTRLLDHPDAGVARYLAVLVRIIDSHRGMTGQKVLGRKKVEKLVHVIEAHLTLDLGREPIRAAAGPLDMARHKSVCRIAEERDIFQAIEPELSATEVDETTNPREAVRFEPLERFDQAVNEAVTALGERSGDLDRLLAQLMKLNPAQAEIVATLYAVWNDLIQAGKTPRDEELFQAFWEWHPDKAKFTQTALFVELAWMRQVGIVPKR